MRDANILDVPTSWNPGWHKTPFILIRAVPKLLWCWHNLSANILRGVVLGGGGSIVSKWNVKCDVRRNTAIMYGICVILWSHELASRSALAALWYDDVIGWRAFCASSVCLVCKCVGCLQHSPSLPSISLCIYAVVSGKSIVCMVCKRSSDGQAAAAAIVANWLFPSVGSETAYLNNSPQA